MRMAMSEIRPVPDPHRRLGASLVEAGLLSPEDRDRVLAFQREHCLRFGEAAVRLGLVTSADVQFALSRQFDYSYLRREEGITSMSEELVAAFQPFGPAADHFRALRSQLMLRWFDRTRGQQVLAVVGTTPGEGRSYLAANLAITFSQLGESTLLIDGDLRTPRQHYLFSLQNQMGLSSLLAGRARDEAIVRITDLPGLFVLPAGPTPPNPLELVARSSFDEMLAQARQNFGIIIIDTPALSWGEEAALMAVRGGAALAVARTGQTEVAAFSDMLRGLSRSQVTVIGSVLNDVPAGKKKKAAA